MRADLHYETRSETIFRHTREMFHTLRTDQWSFAQAVVECYIASVPEIARTIEFSLSGDVVARLKKNGQKVFRYMDPKINARLPVDLEEAWVRTLQQPFRDACVRDLSARYGLLAVEISGVSTRADISSVGRVAASAGQVFERMAPIISDGIVDQSDHPFIPDAIEALTDLMSAAGSLIERLNKALND